MLSGDGPIKVARPPGGYSADVRIQLLVNGRRLAVAKLAPDRIYLADPNRLTETTGEIVLSIDGDESRRHVILEPSGQESHIVRIRLAEC